MLQQASSSEVMYCWPRCAATVGHCCVVLLLVWASVQSAREVRLCSSHQYHAPSKDFCLSVET